MTQHRKLKNKQHDPHQKLGVISGAPIRQSFLFFYTYYCAYTSWSNLYEVLTSYKSKKLNKYKIKSILNNQLKDAKGTFRVLCVRDDVFISKVNRFYKHYYFKNVAYIREVSLLPYLA